MENIKKKSRSGFDIREYKRTLRERYKAIRQSIGGEERRHMDACILRAITATQQYASCKTVLTYVSTKQEADTHELIKKALGQGKRVAVPYCIEGTRNMDFYLIGSMDELEQRTFGVLEPVVKKSKKLSNFSDSICILPGLSFDLRGYRLGYGGGYYDRFLSKKYRGFKIGICYEQCIRSEIICGKYDVSSDIVITENRVITTKKELSS